MPFRQSLVCASALLSFLALTGGCSSTDGGSPSDAGGHADASAPPVLDAGDDATVVSPDPDASDDAGTVSQLDAADAAEDTGPRPTYLNPVINQDFPDPFILREGTTYYAFGTNGASKNIQSASSTDLAHWTVLGDALPTLPAWAPTNAGLTWAPTIIKIGANYVMYYTTRDTASGFQCVSHAVATNPAGPYVDTSTSAFVCQVTAPQALCGSIDPSPFVDTDGTLYLVWKSDENASACAKPPRLWSAPLSSDGMTLTAAATQLLIMDQNWQKPIIEGPSMTLINGTYFLLYSANNYESAAYSMGYATCLSASGPCQNVSTAGPLVASAGSALGPGGGEFFNDSIGGRWLVYHAWTAPTTTYSGGGARSMRIDRIGIADGGLSLTGPTTTPESL